MTSTAPDEAAGKPGPADLLEIFYAPSAVFARRREGSFGLPYVALVVLGIGLFFATKNLIQPVIDAEISRQIAVAAAKNNMTPDQIAKMTGSGQMIASVGIIAFYVVAPFVVGLLIWLIGMLARIAGAGRVAIMIAVFSLFPRLLSTVVGAIFGAIFPDSSLTSPASLTLSPARFIDAVHAPGLAMLLVRFDVFILWGIVLIAIGLQATTRATKGQTWTTAIGVWVIGTLPAIWRMIISG